MTRRARAIVVILLAGLLAGTLDIGAAFAVYAPRGVSPVRILQGIASGLVGAEAFAGGAAAAALGGLLHYLIATGAAAVYYLASRYVPTLRRCPVASGLAYGVLVYLVMNLVVVPLSAAAQGPFVFRWALLIVAIHMFCVGLPIALVVRGYEGTDD